MYKRSAEGDGGGDAKKGPGASGLKGKAGGTVDDQSVDPIPRHLPQNSVTLNFVQRSWEEIGPGELKYLPLSQSPYYMFDDNQLNKLMGFLHDQELWESYEIHQPHARITNLIMLQDDLVNAGGTPMETTAFTQACYLLHVQPVFCPEYFKFVKVNNPSTGVYTDCTINMTGLVQGQDHTYLKSLSNYDDFETLGIIPAQINKSAGFVPNQIPNQLVPTHSIMDVYIPPGVPFGTFSANLQPNAPDESVTWLESLGVNLYMRNQDKISLYKYGDTIDLDINTNLNGKRMINDPYNDFTVRTHDVTIQGTEGLDTVTVNAEWYWPGQNRPYYSRSDNFGSIQPMLHPKSLGFLKHHFLTMPPIRKANGSILKQRCSFMLEQEISITIHFQQNAWGEDDERANLLNQKDAIIVRPVMYGTFEAAPTPPPKETGPLCIGRIKCEPPKRIKKQRRLRSNIKGDHNDIIYQHPARAQTCWPNTFGGMLETWMDCLPAPNTYPPFMTENLETGLKPDVRTEQLTNSFILYNDEANFHVKWLNFIDQDIPPITDPDKFFYIYVETRQIILHSPTRPNDPTKTLEKDMDSSKNLQISLRTLYTTYLNLGITCEYMPDGSRGPMYANYRSENRTTPVFLC